jgi:hypothetical protein
MATNKNLFLFFFFFLFFSFLFSLLLLFPFFIGSRPDRERVGWLTGWLDGWMAGWLAGSPAIVYIVFRSPLVRTFALTVGTSPAQPCPASLHMPDTCQCMDDKLPRSLGPSSLRLRHHSLLLPCPTLPGLGPGPGQSGPVMDPN